MSYRELVVNQDKQKLVDIVVPLSEKYPEIENEVSALIGVLDEKKEIEEMKQHIRQVIRFNKVGGFIYSSGCDNILSEFNELIDRCLTRSEQEFYEVAYSILLDIVEQSIKLASTADSSNGTVTEIMELVLNALIVVGNTVNQGSDATLKKICLMPLYELVKRNYLTGGLMIVMPC